MSTLTGRSTELTTLRMSSIDDERGRVEHVGARLLEALQPQDRVGEVLATVEVVLRARAVSTKSPLRCAASAAAATRSVARSRS